VELDLACGLFDLQDSVAVEAAERALLAAGPRHSATDNATSGDSDGDSRSTSESDDADEHGGKAQHEGLECAEEAGLRPTKKKRRQAPRATVGRHPESDKAAKPRKGGAGIEEL
jgi:hypothetical protein